MTAKIRYQVNKTWIEVDVANPKDAIKKLQEYLEVFGITQCGACKSDQVTPSHRQVDGNDYYEMRCLACGAALKFGQTKVGDRLFAKRKDKDGNLLDKGGWEKYQKRGDSYE